MQKHGQSRELIRKLQLQKVIYLINFFFFLRIVVYKRCLYLRNKWPHLTGVEVQRQRDKSMDLVENVQ